MNKLALQVSFFDVYKDIPFLYKPRPICRVFKKEQDGLDGYYYRPRILGFYECIEDYTEANAQMILEQARSEAKRKLDLCLSPEEQRLLGLHERF